MFDKVRYTNPETGKPLLSKNTESAYKKLDKTFYAMKESEDALMAKLRRFESEADSTRANQEEEEEDEEEVELEAGPLLDYDEWVASIPGSKHMSEEMLENRYI